MANSVKTKIRHIQIEDKSVLCTKSAPNSNSASIHILTKKRIEHTRKKLNKVNVSNVDKMKKLESENVRIEQKVQFQIKFSIPNKSHNVNAHQVHIDTCKWKLMHSGHSLPLPSLSLSNVFIFLLPLSIQTVHVN